MIVGANFTSFSVNSFLLHESNRDNITEKTSGKLDMSKIVRLYFKS